MKKIIILLSLIFVLTGCYDNVELDDLAIVSGIGIDYKDDNYYLTYEILADTKTDDNTNLLSYAVSGEGKNISEAFINTNYKVSKKAYFSHLKVLVLSESVLDGHLEEITDYILRDTDLRSDFKIVIANKTTPEEILKNNDDNHPVVSETITDKLDNEKYNNSLSTKESFREIASKLISPNYDVIFNTISIEDKTITLNNSYILKDYQYQNELSKTDSSLYNLLVQDTISLEFNKEYENGTVIISINNSNTNMSINKDTITINTTLEGKMLENNAKFDLKNTDSYEQLNSDFSKLIENKITKFIKLLQENDSDILGFQKLYYQSTRKENQGLWKQCDIDVNVNLKINTKGFIFEVENEK